MKNFKTILFATILVFCLTGTFSLFAGDGNGWTIKYERPKCFIENKGQFHVPKSSEKVIYAYENGFTTAYFTKKGVVYSFLKTWKKDETENEEREIKENAEKIKSPEDYKKIEAEEHRLEFKTDQVGFEWENSNPNVEIVAEDAMDSYFSYMFKVDGKMTNENFIKGFKKITYKNLYPHIDVEYVFHPIDGIKYSIILRPGADPSQIKMKYASGEKLSFDNNDLFIKTVFGNLTDHAPVTFYQNSRSTIINSKFIKTGNTISFHLDNYNAAEAVVIDPWTVMPAFATNWDCVWECEHDGAGNVFIIGGVTPLQLLKYNSAGTLQWTYNTPYDTTSWLGTFATDNAGNSYVTQGSVAQILKVNAAGGLVWSNTSPGGIFGTTEFWSIAFNCDQTLLVIGGTGGGIPPKPYIYNVNTATGNVTSSVQVHGGGGFTGQEIRAITSCGNGKYYYLSHDSIGFISQNFSFCPSYPAGAYHRNNQYTLGYKCENYRYDNTGICAIKASSRYVYTHKGSAVDKRSLTTANIITSAPIAGGAFTAGGFGSGNYVENSGIDIDACGNVYVGSKTSVVKYDSNLVLLATYPVSFNVYDVHVTPGGEIIACGSTGNSGTSIRTGYIQSISAAACANLTLTCCDPSICGPTSLCSSAAPVTLQAATSGGTWSGTGVSAGGVFSPSVSGVGTFVITYTLACGSGTLSIVVDPCTALTVCQNSGPTFTVSGGTGPYTWQNQVTTTPCVAGLGFCSTFGTVAGPPVTSWSTYATGTTVTPAGTYPQQVVDNNGTVYSITSLASIPPCSGCPALTANITSQVNVACFGASTGSFNASTTGGATPWDYTLMNGATTVATFNNVAGTQSFTGLAAGTYTLNILDNNGCPGSATITITQPSAPTTTAAAGPDQTVCGTTATLAGNTATVGTGTWTLVSGAGTITTPSSPTSGITALGVGANVFQWTIANAPCPSTTDQVTITGVAAPTTSNAGPNQSICSASTTLAGNAPTTGTGTWTLVSGAGTITMPSSATSGVTGLGAGANVFQWTITNAPCPPSSSTVTITNTGGPTTSAAGPTQTVCGTTATLAGNTPTVGTGAWTTVSGSGTATTPTSPTSGVTGLSVGANVFMWTISSAPCPPSTDTVTIFGIAPPTTSVAGPNQSGCSSSATLAGNMPTVGTGTWTLISGSGTITTPSSPTSGVTGLGTGSNVFQWTISNAPCPASSSTVTITNTGGPTVNITGQNNVMCFGGATGDATALEGSGATPFDYVWNDGAGVIHTDNNITTSSTATGLAAGTYTVTLTDSLGCSSIQTVTITQPATPADVAITASTNAPCGSSTGNATAQASGGVGPYDYVWTGSAGVLQTTLNSGAPNTLSGIAAGTYTITITDANGCIDSTTAIITNTGGATVSITSQTNVLCFGATTGSATANATGGASPYDYVWTGSAGTLQTTLDITVPNTLSGLGAGTYTVTVTDNTGCVSTANVTITQPASAVSVASTTVTNATCGSSNGSATVLASGGTVGSGYTYSWAPSGGSAATASSLAANTYTVTATDGNGCTTTTTVLITNSGGPTVTIPTQTNVLCNGGSTGSATAAATGGSGIYTYSWTGGGGTAATATGLAAGTYTVTVNDGSCSNTATVTITQPAAITGTVTTVPTVCTSSLGTASVTASNGTSPYTYSWNTTETTASIDSLASGVYTVTITDANGCTQIASGTVGTTGSVTATVSPDVTITLGDNAQLTATGGGTYTWSPATGLSCSNCANPIASPTTTTQYCVSVDSATCVDTACVTVDVDIPCPTNTDLAVPNAFSPNGDGHNDNFCLRGWGVCITDFSVFIYDRWGEKVFESTDAGFCWDGTYKGKQLDPAVFVYYIKATFSNDLSIDKKGNISLIR